MMTPLVSVALGGALGASLRYLTGQTLARALGAGFPWGTFAVNILGSFLMGLAFVMLAQQTRLSPLLMTDGDGLYTAHEAKLLARATPAIKAAIERKTDPMIYSAAVATSPLS